MTEFVKLYGSILDSTVWLQALPTKVVWITMLAMADWEGFVSAAIPTLAKRAGVTRNECEAALGVLGAPDPDSKTKEFEGRRIEQAEGGWKILNHGKYRDMRTERQVKTAERVAKHRASKKGALPVTDVTRSNTVKRSVRTDVDTTKTTTQAGVTRNTGWVGRFLTAYTEATKGSYSAGRLGRELKDLIRDNGENPAFAAWTIFLASPDRRFGPPYFAKNYVDYSPGGKLANTNGQRPNETAAEYQFRKRGYIS